MSSRPCWDCRWKAQVGLNASMSTCSRRGVGGVLVKDKRLVADGFNGNFPGAKHCIDGGCERCADPTIKSGEKLSSCVCLHCEPNIITYCAKLGRPTAGTTIYLNLSPCLECFKLLVSSGVREIVYDEKYPDLNTIEILAKENDVRMRTYECYCPPGGRKNNGTDTLRSMSGDRKSSTEKVPRRPLYQRILLRLGFLRTL